MTTEFNLSEKIVDAGDWGMSEDNYWLIWKFVCIIMGINGITLIAIYNWDLGTFYLLQSMHWVMLLCLGGIMIYLSLIRSKLTKNKKEIRI